MTDGIPSLTPTNAKYLCMEISKENETGVSPPLVQIFTSMAYRQKCVANCGDHVEK